MRRPAWRPGVRTLSFRGSSEAEQPTVSRKCAGSTPARGAGRMLVGLHPRYGNACLIDPRRPFLRRALGAGRSPKPVPRGSIPRRRANWGRGPARSGRLPVKQETGSSNLLGPARVTIAQSVERPVEAREPLVRLQFVTPTGSSPKVGVPAWDRKPAGSIPAALTVCLEGSDS